MKKLLKQGFVDSLLILLLILASTWLGIDVDRALLVAILIYVLHLEREISER